MLFGVVKTQPITINMLVSSSALGPLVLHQKTEVEILQPVQEIALSIQMDGQGLFFYLELVFIWFINFNTLDRHLSF